MPVSGEWAASPGVGWQHGPIPAPEGALHPSSLEVWQTWMRSWWAAHWTPEDLPGLNLVIQLYDLATDYFREPMIEKEYVTPKGDTRTVWVAKPNPTTELRQMLDNFGISPKGRQDRHWSAPKADELAVPKRSPRKAGGGAAEPGVYGHLRAVSGGAS